MKGLHNFCFQCQGHKKAVSYVKFINTHEIISAGTDGQLKLWNVNKPPFCLRSFVGGHVNEKNFVGLATNGGKCLDLRYLTFFYKNKFLDRLHRMR